MNAKTSALAFSAYFVAMIMLSMVLPQSNASASNVILNSFSASSSPINAGGSSTWTLGLTLNTTHSGEQFSSANLVFSSGNGKTSLFNGPLTGSSVSIGNSFVYESGGTYFGSVSGTVVGSWQQSDPVYEEVVTYDASGAQIISYGAWTGSYVVNNYFESFTIGPGYNVIQDYTFVPGTETCNYTDATGSIHCTATEDANVITGSHSEIIFGQLTASWFQNDPVYTVIQDYTFVPEWSYETCGFTDATGYYCITETAGGYVNTGSHSELIGYQINTHTEILSFDALTVTSVPEPEIYAMMGLGLGLLGWVGRRRNLKAA